MWEEYAPRKGITGASALTFRPKFPSSSKAMKVTCFLLTLKTSNQPEKGENRECLTAQRGDILGVFFRAVFEHSRSGDKDVGSG